jgi:hypothetical protein
MITLNTQLQKVMASQNLEGLRPFAYLYRNKWNSTSNKYELENTAIDISSMIVKPNTLSMTLDVNEIAQFNANNITLTLTDYENKFIEGAPNSFFPSGYQLYGSRVVLYYGTSTADMTSLFVGVIKDLPTHKPEQYQVDLKLISPLELLDDIEAKDFSDKYAGEALTPYGNNNNNPIYRTANNKVGGFNAVYGNGIKLFEGVDYEVSQINDLSLPALITIINSSHASDTITADYYCWKTGLSVEEIVSGLVALGGYTSNTDIRNVVWNTAVGNLVYFNPLGAFGFKLVNTKCEAYRIGGIMGAPYYAGLILPNNFKISWQKNGSGNPAWSIGDTISTSGSNYIPANGIVVIESGYIIPSINLNIYQNSVLVQTFDLGFANSNYTFSLERNGNNFTATVNNGTTQTETFNYNFTFNEMSYGLNNSLPINFEIEFRNSNNDNIGLINLGNIASIDNCIITNLQYFGASAILQKFNATREGTGNYRLSYRYGETLNSMSNWNATGFGTDIGVESKYFQFLIQGGGYWLNSDKIYTFVANFLISTLTLNLVNLSGKSVLEALQDLALISGYEFGVDRSGIFFFRPRSQSTTPIFELDESEIVKIDNIKQNFNDFFTKLTLTFAQIPLEFYANEGTRPTPIDKYGVINKEIDKPDIVNYDNPELAQAIGPQLLEVYSDLSDVIQCTAKLNLSLELGDIVNVKRNYNLNTPDAASDYEKFINQNTYYRACKITGINYNLSKRQMTYTLKDVSNSNNIPAYDGPRFVYDLPIQL